MDRVPPDAPLSGGTAPNTTAPLVANVAGLLNCPPFSVPGLLVALRARKHVPGDPARARQLTSRAWLLFSPCVVFVLFFFATQPQAALSLVGL
ncbi:hypothetical protein [Nocardiopsis coralliicola]